MDLFSFHFPFNNVLFEMSYSVLALISLLFFLCLILVRWLTLISFFFTFIKQNLAKSYYNISFNTSFLQVNLKSSTDLDTDQSF